MKISQRVTRAAKEAQKALNNGESVKSANRRFELVAGFDISYDTRENFIKIINFYAED